jgi:replicative DNA helicase
VLDASGGAAALIALRANTPAISCAGRYARIVQEHALLRRLIAVAHEIAEIGYEFPVDVAGALDQAEAMVFDVAQRRNSDSVRSLKDLLTESLERLDHLYGRGETITGVPTGYGELDHLLSGASSPPTWWWSVRGPRWERPLSRSGWRHKPHPLMEFRSCSSRSR